MEREFQVCSNCVMDTSDIKIIFDDKGVCDNCHSFYNLIEPVWTPNELGRDYLIAEFDKIKIFVHWIRELEECLLW